MSGIEVDRSINKNKSLAEYGGITIVGEKEPGQTIIQADNSEYATSTLSNEQDIGDSERLRAENEARFESSVRATPEGLQGKRPWMEEVLADKDMEIKRS
jgi:hypothetical protein